MDNSLNGKQVHVFTGSGYQVCTIECTHDDVIPFRARSQRNGFTINFNTSVAKRLRKGTAPNMTLLT